MTEKLLDPDCKQGKHRACSGGPCECDCHAPSVGSDATNHTDVTQSPAPDGNASETGTQSREELRQRYAALFRHAPGEARLGDQTPGEIADAVLAVRDNELNANRTMARFRHRQAVAERDRAEAAEAKLAKVRELHHEDDSDLIAYCDHCRVQWPCPTIRALDGDGQ